MQLNNVYIDGNTEPQHISIKDGYITAVSDKEISGKGLTISFDAATAFPGLINSHDHLDFNLFPQLNNKIYQNYKEWAADIHFGNNEKIMSIRQIPKQLRVEWGIFKNLINGVTAVIEHGNDLVNNTSLIHVLQNNRSLHSVGFEKKWKWKLIKPLSEQQYIVIHIGEGTDQLAADEINKYIKSNIFKKKTVAVHGVAMNIAQAKNFTALVWCPAANYNVLGKTTAVDLLKKETTILFGTDSTLTGDWNIWEQLRNAKKLGLVTEKELFDMVTVNPAMIWGLNELGDIKPRMQADIVVAKKQLHSIFDTDPENILLIVRQGDLKLFDVSLLPQLRNNGYMIKDFARIKIGGTEKFVKGDLPGLIRKIKTYYPEAVFPIQADT